MFTGLVREIGRLTGKTSSGGLARLTIDAPELSKRLALGDSVAVNGICLTVTAVKGRSFSADAAVETQRLTTLNTWRRGQRVHLEPALRAGDSMDGHIVQGHIDGVGKVKNIQKVSGSQLITVSCEPRLAALLTTKGSVAVDGVSLTVDEGPFSDSFTVNLIPHTLTGTTFGDLRKNQTVNLEMDVLVKAARTDSSAAKNKPAAGLTLERLLAKGFGKSASRHRKG